MSIKTDHLHDDLPRRSVRSGAAVLIAQAISIALGIVSVAVLGRLLSPEDFGVVAIASSFVAFVTMFADHGLPQSIVQREGITEPQVNALFWLNCACGLGAALIGCLVAWPVSIVFERPELFGVIAALSAILVITGLGAPHLALLQRQLRFRTHSIIGVVASFLGIITATVTALLGWGYWALVMMTVANTLFRTVAAWATCHWRPSKPALAEGIGPMVRIGAYLAGTSLVGTIARTADRIMIGYGLGNAAAGFYANANRLILLPTNQVNTPLSSVAVPVFSRLQNDPERFRAFYRRGVEVIFFVLSPFILVAMVGADHIVPLFLGAQWADSIPIFQALTPAALIACTRVVTSWVYVPLGRTDRQFKWRVFASIFMIGALLIGLNWGAVGVAAAFSIQALLIRGPAILYCLHGTFVQLNDVLSATWRVVLAIMVTLGVGFTFISYLGDRFDDFWSIVLIAIVVFTTYAAAFSCTPGGWSRIRAMREVSRHLRSGSTREDAAVSEAD